MNADIITIGNELLNGSTANTNAGWIADRLWRIGITTRKIVTVRDEIGAIQRALDESLQHVELLFVTGGLGPTHDDITKRSVAEYYRVPLIENLSLRKRIEALFSRRKLSMPSVNLEQALIPEGAEIIPNEIGTAAGFFIEQPGKVAFIMPGVPAEMKKMMGDTILPLLQKKYSHRLKAIVYRLIRTSEISESHLYEILAPIEKKFHQIEIAFLPHHFGVDIRLGTSAQEKNSAEKRINEAQAEIIPHIEPFIYEIGERDLNEVIADCLTEKKLSLSVAESCTGGLIQNLLTHIPGSSQFFLGGVIAYHNTLKLRLLGVKEKTLEKYGAVSHQTAREMVQGIQSITGSDCALSTTGIAGPTGGTANKPIGLVYIGCMVQDTIIVKKYFFHKERLQNKYRFAYAALNLLRHQINQS